MPEKPEAKSTIIFFYYEDLGEPARFYREVMGCSLVDDQGWAKIFEVGNNSFLGIVREEEGYCGSDQKEGVLLTFVVEDVRRWYEYLKSEGVEIEKEIEEHKDIGVRCFFIGDPGGYPVEIQQFTEPSTQRLFG